MANAQFFMDSWRVWTLLRFLVFLPLGVFAQGEVTFWYGSDQYFGDNGQPQRWVNVLGNVSESDQLESLSWKLNGVHNGNLNWGVDLHRLALPGDFNVELRWDQLNTGTNELTVRAVYKDGREIAESTRLHIQHSQIWPLPYSVDFSRLDTLQKAVQVVDGHWELNEQGVHTVQRYYDRVLSLGDSTWQDYEALIELTLHSFTPSEPGPPTYNVTHFGVALWWRGHHDQAGKQPNRKWWPLGCQGELLLKSPPDSTRWRILFDAKHPKPVYSRKRNTYRTGTPMLIRAQVNRTSRGGVRYRFKQWMADSPEPIDWDAEGIEAPEDTDYIGGALCLVPHNSEVTIHRVEVFPMTR